MDAGDDTSQKKHKNCLLVFLEGSDRLLKDKRERQTHETADVLAQVIPLGWCGEGQDTHVCLILVL